MKMHTRLIALAAAMALSASAFAAHPAGFWVKPAIPAYGPVHIWPEAIDRPSPNKTYKALFDVTQGKPAADQVNPGLDHIARAVNTFVAAGVPLSHLKFDVIIHGGATPIALNEKAYMAKFGHANPNLAVIADLKKAGVNVMVCGNALGDMDFTPAEVNPDIKVALSALSTLIIQQNQGYALMRM
ncbi:MAG: DsrE family protein [Metallibacterium scheffleri]